jgi:hypothetical protein
MIALAFAALQQQPAGSLADVRTLQLPSGVTTVGATAADVDGDGTFEVVVAAHDDGKPFARQLQVWRVPSGPGAGTLIETLPLTADVVAFTVGDVREGGGDELVLFNAGGAFSWRPSGPPEQRLERLVECDVLWQAADPEEVHLWDGGVRDIDGDGLADLVIPGPGAYTLAMQRRPRASGAPFGAISRIQVPEDADDTGVWLSATRREGPAVRGRRSRREMSISLGGEDTDEGERVLVSVSESVPSAQWIDWDGDGDLDLLAQTTKRLHVWTQAEGKLAEAPALSLDLPVEIDTARRLDTSYSAHAVDLDRDKRADYVVFAGDKRSEDVRTQGLFFAQAAVKPGPDAGSPLFGREGRPSNLLVFAGFVTEPRFRDLDGDGYPELILRAVRPDLIDQLRSASTETIDATLFVYRNRKGVLSRQPDVTWKHEIPLKRFQLTAQFAGDVTGDGVSELFVRDAPERVRVLYLRPQPGAGAATTWTLVDRPLWELPVSKHASVELVTPRAARRPGAATRPELLVIEPHQVLSVRFK